MKVHVVAAFFVVDVSHQDTLVHVCTADVVLTGECEFQLTIPIFVGALLFYSVVDAHFCQLTRTE